VFIGLPTVAFSVGTFGHDALKRFLCTSFLTKVDGKSIYFLIYFDIRPVVYELATCRLILHIRGDWGSCC